MSSNVNPGKYKTGKRSYFIAILGKIISNSGHTLLLLPGYHIVYNRCCNKIHDNQR